jgi:two-component system response regulator RpfG
MQTVLIIDDQELTRMILTEFARSLGPDVAGKAFENPSDALAWVQENPVAMAIVDYRMPGMDGIEFIRRLHDLPAGGDVPVVMITALDDYDKEIRYKALNAGVVDFLSKPLDYSEWRIRCRNILELQKHLHQNQTCKELATVLFRITQSFNGRNPWRLAGISRHIAEQIRLSSKECDLIEGAAPMNDLGHFFVPYNLLSRSSKLRQKERITVQSHTLAGYHLLQASDSELYRKAARIALSHHEQYDGKGYPHGFGGKDIPLEARIVSVADFVDALLSDRPYRRAWTIDRVFGYLKSFRGKRFDPDCVDAFFQRSEDILLSDIEPLPNPLRG